MERALILFIIVLSAAIAYGLWVVVFRGSFESLENTGDAQKTKVAKMILDMLSQNISYDDYLQRMTTVRNTSMQVLDIDIFNDMQQRSAGGMLTESHVLSYMSDWI
jgi:hypothetical protein